MAHSGRSGLIARLLAGAAILAGLGYLFVHSLESTRSDPYSVARAHLADWRLELDPAAPGGVLLSVRTSGDLVSNLFRQVFQRVMESMVTPQGSSIPIVLRGEFDRALAGRMTPEELLAAARAAGLEEGGTHEPRCLAHRRTSQGRDVRQAYFVLFESPSLVAFREQLAGLSGGTLEAAALSPVMLVGSTEGVLDRWLPLRADTSDCVAPIQVDG